MNNSQYTISLVEGARLRVTVYPARSGARALTSYAHTMAQDNGVATHPRGRFDSGVRSCVEPSCKSGRLRSLMTFLRYGELFEEEPLSVRGANQTRAMRQSSGADSTNNFTADLFPNFLDSHRHSALTYDQTNASVTLRKRKSREKNVYLS